VQALVAWLGEQEAAGRPAVAPRAAGLLVEGLHGLGHGLVADRAHVCLVHAHPERVRGDHQRHVASHETPLRLGALLASQAGVVDEGLDAQRSPEPGCERLAAGPGAGVDDRRQGLGLGQRRGDLRVL